MDIYVGLDVLLSLARSLPLTNKPFRSAGFEITASVAKPELTTRPLALFREVRYSCVVQTPGPSGRVFCVGASVSPNQETAPSNATTGRS
jgi:hypothetical protein